jgi:hypothetical protein
VTATNVYEKAHPTNLAITFVSEFQGWAEYLHEKCTTSETRCTNEAQLTTKIEKGVYRYYALLEHLEIARCTLLIGLLLHHVILLLWYSAWAV